MTLRGSSRRFPAVAVSLALLFATAEAGARARGKDEAGGSFAGAFRATPAVLGETLVSPLHWKGKDLARLAVVVGAGLALSLADETVREQVLKRRTAGSDELFGVITKAGEGLYLGGFLAGLFAVGQISSNDGLRTTAWLGVESYLVSSAFSTALKLAVGRARPGAGEGSGSFHPFSTRSAFTSMPSGHATSAWAVATVIADRTKSPIVDIACYGAAALASLSRIHEDKHWASDALVGSALGYFTAKKVCALNRDARGPRLSASFGPVRGGRAVTLTLTF